MPLQLPYCPPLIMSTRDRERIDEMLAASQTPPPGAWLLKRKFERVTLVEPEEVPPTVVTMHSKVLFMDLDNACEYGLTLSYPEQEPEQEPGAVSVFTPIGAALLGLAEGQDIHWIGRSGRKLRLRVLKLVYQPEASGCYVL